MDNFDFDDRKDTNVQYSPQYSQNNSRDTSSNSQFDKNIPIKDTGFDNKPSGSNSVAVTGSATRPSGFNRFSSFKNSKVNESDSIAKSYNKSPIKEIIVDEIYHPFYVFSIEPIPENIKEKILEVAKVLEEYKYTLRTDTVSEISRIFEPLMTRKEEFLPWNDFNDKKSKFAFNTISSKILAKMFNPKFDDMKKPVQAFQCRNARSILGQNVKSPIQIAIIWSPDGAEHVRNKTQKSSFISHQLALASALRIPIFNLENDESVSYLKEYLAL